MDVKVKALLAILPFGIAIAVGASLAMPAYTEYSDKSAQAEERKTQQEELQNKLANKSKIQREKKDLEDLIEKLRANVPKQPQLELMNIDVEKMADESNIDLVAFGRPDKETLSKMGMDENGQLMEAAQTSKQRLKAGLKAAAVAASGGGITTSSSSSNNGNDAKKDKEEAPPDAGLAKAMVQVKVIGDYNGIQSFIKKLETYQRTVEISQFRESIPRQVKATDVKTGGKSELPDDAVVAEGEDPGDHKRLNATLLVTAYYLP